MTMYKGLFSDTFFQCEADTEAEAQAKMKEELLKKIAADDEPLIVWEDA